MAHRYFELIENKSIDEDRELHAQFKHHLDHVVKVTYMPDTNGKHLVVTDRDEESIEAIFGGPNNIFVDLYFFDEYSRF